MKRIAALALLLAAPLSAAGAEDSDPATETVHVVKPGETIGGVANRAVVPRILIIEANGLKAPYALKAGQKLIIPRRRTHTVEAGETGFAIALQYGVPWEAIATANGLNHKAPVKAGTKLAIPTITAAPAATPSQPAATAPAATKSADSKPSISVAANAPRFAWPAPGKLLRGFTPNSGRNPHTGIDLAGEMGSAVRAVGAGRVVYAGYEPKKFGNLVVIDHGKGWHTAYAKLQKVTVKKGDRAKAGERVGLLGNTGETPRTELHFEVRRYNLPIDPELVLPARD
ncbi:MAG: peptidoglycan DD-metalloendopeptidase family protein [Novosphingobium sp.]